MATKEILFALHGVGTSSEDEFRTQCKGLEARLKRPGLEVVPIYWGRLFNARQSRMFKLYDASLDMGMDTLGHQLQRMLRRVALTTVGDATGLSPNNTANGEDVYASIHALLYDEIRRTLEAHKGEPVRVAVLAQSLGAHLISTYLWDAQTGRNFFSDPTHVDPLAPSMSRLITTGCNIPLFVSGLDYIQAVYNDRAGYVFKWFNYYFREDPLGWPLQPLGAFASQHSSTSGQSYMTAVKDVRLVLDTRDGPGSGADAVVAWLARGHTFYWEHANFVSFLHDHIGSEPPRDLA